MTVATTQISEVWTGDASSVTFPIPFPFLDREHLIVWKEDAGGAQTAMTISTATGEGEPSGGSITLTAPVGVGYTLHVRRNTPKTQETDYVPHDPFPADSHERALDKLTMIVQELLASGSIDIDINHLGDLIGGSSTIIWTRSPDGTKLIGSVVPGAGDTYKVKVNLADTVPGFLEDKLADTTDTQFTPTEDGSQLDNIVYQLTGLGTRLNRVKDAGFDFELGSFPQANYAGGRGISFGRRFVAGVEVDTWVAQANNGKLYWTSNNDASRWKVVDEDLSAYTTLPNDRAHYGWSCIQFVYVAGTHNCFCWVMGSGDHERHITFVEHKAENYNADGTFKASALDGVTYPVGTGPYTPIDIMQVDTSGGIFIAGDDPNVGFTTDLANFQLAVTADHNVGGLGFDGEDTVQVIERDYGVIWRSTNLGAPGTFSKVATFYLDDVPVSNFPMYQPGGTAAQWGSMFSMYGQWLSINFHYVAGGIGFIYSDDGIYWYSSRDEATPFYDANNDGLRWFATNAVPNSGAPIFQLIVSMIPAHRRMSLEKGAVVSGPLILRELPNAPLLGTDHRGRIKQAVVTTPSTPTERHLIGVGEGGNIEQFTYPASTLSLDGIIEYLDDRDRGYKWAARNSPITYYGPNTLVSDPFHGTVVAVTRYGDVRVSGDGFDTFSEASVGNAGSRAYGFYDSNRHRIFIPSNSSTSPDVWSDDGGYTWSQGVGVTSKLVQQSGAKYNATHDTYIISANGDVWVSEDGGATFAITQTGDTWTRSAVGVSPSGLTVHLRWLSGTNQLSCRISTDGGLTWGASEGLYSGTGYRPDAIIWASKSSKFIVSCNNYILTSVDGITWTAYTTHLGDWSVLLEDPNTKHIWRFNSSAPSGVRTAFSSDGGITWRHFAGGAISGGSDYSVTVPIIYDCVYDYKSRRFIRLCNNESSLGSVIEISPP